MAEREKFDEKKESYLLLVIGRAFDSSCENEGMAEKGLVADDDHPSSYSKRRGRRMNFWTGFLLCSPGRGC